MQDCSLADAAVESLCMISYWLLGMKALCRSNECFFIDHEPTDLPAVTLAFSLLSFVEALVVKRRSHAAFHFVRPVGISSPKSPWLF